MATIILVVSFVSFLGLMIFAGCAYLWQQVFGGEISNGDDPK